MKSEHYKRCDSCGKTEYAKEGIKINNSSDRKYSYIERNLYLCPNCIKKIKECALSKADKEGMIETQINALRILSEIINRKWTIDYGVSDALREAADTIEALSAKLTAAMSMNKYSIKAKKKG